MDLQEIEKQIKALEIQRRAILDSQRATVLAEVRKQVKTYGFTASELGLGVGVVAAAADEQTSKPRKAKGEKAAEDLVKRQNVLAEARAAFEKQIQVRKFTNAETGIAKYHWNGKKGIKPKGDGEVVKSVEEII